MTAILSKSVFRVHSTMSNLPKEAEQWERCHSDIFGDAIPVVWYMVGRRYPLVTYEDVRIEDSTEEILDHFNEHFSKKEAEVLSKYLADHHNCECRVVPAFTDGHVPDENRFFPFTVTTEERVCDDKYTYAFHRDRIRYSFDLSAESSYSLPFKVYGHYADHGHERPMAPADLIYKHNSVRSELNCGCCGDPTVLNVPRQWFYSHLFSEVPLCKKCVGRYIRKDHFSPNSFEKPVLNPTPDGREDIAFGTCPHCRSCDGRLFDGEIVWSFCSSHKTKWPVSTGHFISKSQNEYSLEYAYKSLLTDYQIVEPVLVKTERSDPAIVG